MLPEEKYDCISLYEDSPNRGHWTALLQYGGLYEHFDSCGVKSDSELKWISANRNRMLDQDEPYLTQLLGREEEKYIYNNVASQSKDSRVNACGSRAVRRLYTLKNDDVGLPDYYQYLRSMKDQTNVGYDLIVAEFVSKWL